MAGCGRMTQLLREGDAVGLGVDTVELRSSPSCLRFEELRRNTAVAPDGSSFRQVEEVYRRRMI